MCNLKVMNFGLFSFIHFVTFYTTIADKTQIKQKQVLRSAKKNIFPQSKQSPTLVVLHEYYGVVAAA